jgi:predicted RNA-binding Zn-ribbon protein involved in translation (DUF1610 family)
VGTPLDLMRSVPEFPSDINGVAIERYTQDERRENNLLAPGVPRVLRDESNPPPPPVTPKVVLLSCGKCQSQVGQGDNFCKNCGEPLINACKKCGADNQTGKFCSNCGKVLSAKKSKRATTD